MGLLVPVAEAILAEHCYKKIEGAVLFIGRQRTFLNAKSLDLLLKRYGLSVPAGFTYEFDDTAIDSGGQRLITDRCFLRSIGISNINFLDLNDHEGAEIIHDLGNPVPDSLLSCYDFIYNGSCLDNMFNSGIALTNLSKMLRPGGRVVCLEHASSFNGPYLIFTPGWFWDYYVINGFNDCKIYLGSFFEGDDLSFGPWKWYYVNLLGGKASSIQKNGPAPGPRANNHFVIVSIAEKGAQSTSERQPAQFQYRFGDALLEEYAKNAFRMRSCPRPIILGREGQTYDQYLTSLGKISLGIHARSLTERFKRTVRRYLRALKIVVIIFSGRSVD